MKHKFLYLLSIIIFLAVLSLYWLALGALIFGGAFILIKSSLSFSKAFRKKKWLYITSGLLAVIVLAIATRVFVLDIYNIPSSSMEGSLLVGDKIMVSKLHYGPRLPKSPFEVPWVNLLFYINKEARASMDSTWWQYQRFNGFTKINSNDVIVFNNTTDVKTFYVKRCMGLPGDEISIKKGIVYNNNEVLSTPKTVKYLYEIWFNNKTQFEKSVQHFELKATIKKGNEPTILALTHNQYKVLKANTSIDSTTIINFQIKTQCVGPPTIGGRMDS